MPVLGAVLTLHTNPELQAATLAILASTPGVTLGQATGPRIPVVLESDTRVEDKTLWDNVNNLEGVTFAEVAFADFSDLNAQDEVPRETA